MKRLTRCLLLLAVCLTGCAQNYFNIPAENFADRVKTLGVAPIMIDSGSDIKYPQREQLLQLVADANRRNEQQLVRKLKGTANFYTVALMDSDPQQLFDNLLFRREKRDDAAVQYNKYFWKADQLRDYIRKNNLDALMVVVVSGLTRQEKIYSSNLLSSLSTDYNFLIMTAQIVDAQGTILWEYPNFRRQLLEYQPLINLQYPDFSEAEANLSHAADVKFKTLDGIKRALERKRKDVLFRDTQEPEIYGSHFDEMVSLIKYDSDKAKKEPAPAAAPQPTAEPEKKPAPATAVPTPPAPTVAPAAPAPSPAAVPATAPAAVAPPATPPAPVAAPPTAAPEVVPATGSTL